MSDLQRDIEAVEHLLGYGWEKPSGPSASEAWQRIRARLTPDRERVARAIVKAMRLHPDHYAAFLNEADAAIKAMEGNDDA